MLVIAPYTLLPFAIKSVSRGHPCQAHDRAGITQSIPGEIAAHCVIIALRATRLNNVRNQFHRHRHARAPLPHTLGVWVDCLFGNRVKRVAHRASGQTKILHKPSLISHSYPVFFVAGQRDDLPMAPRSQRGGVRLSAERRTPPRSSSLPRTPRFVRGNMRSREFHKSEAFPDIAAPGKIILHKVKDIF